jgi:hypothetical protein
MTGEMTDRWEMSRLWVPMIASGCGVEVEAHCLLGE